MSVTLTEKTPFLDRALSRKEVAIMTGYSEKTLANYSSLGIGPPFRRASKRKCLYLESEVLAWLRAQPLATRAS